MKKYIIPVILATGLLLSASVSPPRAASKKTMVATCVGDNPCKACKNCKYCKRCSKDSKSCGVCKK